MASFQGVSQAKANGRMDIESTQLAHRDPADFLGLATGADLTAGIRGPEADGEFLAGFAVVVGDDVAGIRVEADEVRDLDVDAGFLLDFADGGLGESFAGFLLAAGDGVAVVVGAADHENAALIVLDER